MKTLTYLTLVTATSIIGLTSASAQQPKTPTKKEATTQAALRKEAKREGSVLHC